MIAYAIRRVALMIPTLFAIMVVNFVIVQAAPGGPIQQMISKLKGNDIAATERVSGAGGELRNQQSSTQTQYRGARGLDPAFIKELEKQYDLHGPMWRQYLQYMTKVAHGNLGISTQYRNRTVNEIIGLAKTKGSIAIDGAEQLAEHVAPFAQRVTRRRRLEPFLDLY